MCILGIFQCGPYPILALKKGDVSLPYDGKFIFAEVNADRAHWKRNAEREFECIKLVTYRLVHVEIVKYVTSLPEN